MKNPTEQRHSQAPQPCSHQFAKKTLFCYLFCARNVFKCRPRFSKWYLTGFLQALPMHVCLLFSPQGASSGLGKLPEGKAGDGSLWRNLGLKARKSRGRWQYRGNREGIWALVFYMGDHGRKHLPTGREAEMRRQAGWKWGRTPGDRLPSALPHPTSQLIPFWFFVCFLAFGFLAEPHSWLDLPSPTRDWAMPPVPIALGAVSPNHWTTREFPILSF